MLRRKKVTKAKQNRPFQTKRAVFMELLSGFEPETSSLPMRPMSVKAVQSSAPSGLSMEQQTHRASSSALKGLVLQENIHQLCFPLIYPFVFLHERSPSPQKATVDMISTAVSLCTQRTGAASRPRLSSFGRSSDSRLGQLSAFAGLLCLLRVRPQWRTFVDEQRTSRLQRRLPSWILTRFPCSAPRFFEEPQKVKL